METPRRACAHVFRAAYCPCLQVGRESGPSTKGALPAKGSVAATGTSNMKISARNQLKGTIANIQEGAADCVSGAAAFCQVVDGVAADMQQRCHIDGG